VNNTWTKKGSIMKLTAFWREKRRVFSMFKILSTYICWKNICKMQHLEGSGTPVLYIGRTVLKGYKTYKNILRLLKYERRIECNSWRKLRILLSDAIHVFFIICTYFLSRYLTAVTISTLLEVTSVMNSISVNFKQSLTMHCWYITKLIEPMHKCNILRFCLFSSG